MSATLPTPPHPGPRLRVAVIGLRMGLGHCAGLIASGLFELVAVCDVSDDALATAVARCPGAEPFKDWAACLAEKKPEVVVVATPNALHHAHAMAALASPGLRAMMLEKPMTIALAHAREIVAAAERRGIALAVNHQRRTWPAFRTMRRLMTAGAIGVPQLIRASCAGDFLSDGTHLVDNVRFLSGDAPVKWVAASVFRETSASFPGTRFGHAVDSGAMAVLEFDTPAGLLRAELFTHDLQPRGRTYQDYEIFGTEGRLWRAGDQAAPQVLLQDTTGGFRQVPLDGFDVPEHPNTSLAGVYVRFHQQITQGYANPMSGRTGLAAMEIVTAVYESARLRRRILFPLDETRQPLAPDRFSLDLMLEAGTI